MNRNQNSHFAYNPTNVDISRSTFDRNCTVKTSFNVGQLIPFYTDEVLPGDTFDVSTSKLVRLQPLVAPIMDNIYLDTYYFFVPNRLIWDHWKQFMGENTESAWLPETTYEVPFINSPATGWETGTIADYMGVPVGKKCSVNALPFRAYTLIVNDWFRDQNLQDPALLLTDDTIADGSNGSNYVTDLAKGGKPFTACKFFDYFTSCLPSPQKGPDVSLDIITGSSNIYGTGAAIPFTNGANVFGFGIGPTGSLNLNDGVIADSKLVPAGTANSGTQHKDGTYFAFATKEQLSGVNPNQFLTADISANAISVNALRYAFQLQKLYEKDARGGSRYIEIIKSHFGVTSPDSRLQRPEYLGGNRMLINVQQVVQTSSSNEKSPQGNAAAFSVTSDTHDDFVKSFTEHGFIIGLLVARYEHTYQQGLERFWSRKDRFDFYWPIFANIGEQPVYNKEIYLSGDESIDNAVFGYNEAYADYRYKPSRTSGEMRSTAPTPLDSWHLGDEYAELPKLSADWIKEDASQLDRCLAVSSKVSNQIFGDFYIKNKTTRPMPMYSIPGLIDHH